MDMPLFLIGALVGAGVVLALIAADRHFGEGWIELQNEAARMRRLVELYRGSHSHAERVAAKAMLWSAIDELVERAGRQ